MNRLVRSIACTLIAIIPFAHSYSQSAVVAAGGDAVGPNGSVAYSIGQFDYDQYSGTTGAINLGVQQPDFVIIIGINEISDRYEIKLFPNPTGDQTSLLLEEEAVRQLNQHLRYELFDLSGKLIMSDQIHETKTLVHTSKLINGEYLLRVISDDQHLKTFKIVKSN